MKQRLPELLCVIALFDLGAGISVLANGSALGSAIGLLDVILAPVAVIVAVKLRRVQNELRRLQEAGAMEGVR